MSYLKLDDIYTLPMLYVGDRLGNNGYIDFINEDEVSSNAIQGIDKYGRIFIVLKIREIETKKCYIQTFFKRYSVKIDDNSWMGTNIVSLKSVLINTPNGMTITQQEMVKNLLKGNIITMTKELYPNNDNMIGNSFVLDKNTKKSCCFC